MTIYQYMPVFLYHTYLPLMKLKKSSGGKFRSTDLQVMSLPRYHCATPLSMSYVPMFYSSFFTFQNILKKLHRRESNPGRKRERLACYQLHHNGLLIICTTYVQFFATFLPSSPLSSYIISRFHGVVGYHITFT